MLETKAELHLHDTLRLLKPSYLGCSILHQLYKMHFKLKIERAVKKSGDFQILILFGFYPSIMRNGL